MAPADQLPDELLFEILGYIDNARRRGNCEGAWGSHERAKGNPKNPVLRFCLVSKRFLRVGEPVLYSFFSNGMDENAQPHTSRRQFLHRIIERPDLAARVSEIRFEVMEGDLGSVTRPTRTMYGIVGYGDERSDEDSDAASEQNHHHDAEEMMLDDSDEEEDENAIQNLNSRADRIAFVTAAHQVEMQNKSAWLEDLRAGNPYAELVLLLCQCLNLSKLLLRVPDKSGYDYNYRNLRMFLSQVEKNNTAGNANGPLRNLRTLEIEYAADKVDSVFALGFPAQYMRDFFTIPSLRELKGYMISTRSRYTEGFETDSEMDPDDLDGPFALLDNSSPAHDDEVPAATNTTGNPLTSTWPNRTSRIQALTLTCANITAETLHTLLTACATLIHLHLSCSSDDPTFTSHHMGAETTPYGQAFHPPSILSALNTHASTLASLTLHASPVLFFSSDDDGDGGGDSHHPVPRLGSLAAFAALKKLSISALLLTGALSRAPATVLTRRGKRVRRWITRAPREPWSALADVLPESLEELGVECDAQAEAAVVRYVTPVVVEIARGTGSGARLARLRRLALEGGWERKMVPARKAELCEALRGCGRVRLVVDGRAHDETDRELLIMVSTKLQASTDQLHKSYREQLERQLSKSARRELERAGAWDELNLDLK